MADEPIVVAQLVLDQLLVALLAKSDLHGLSAAVRCRAHIVEVVGDRLNVGIGVRIEMVAGLALETASLDHVEAMRDDARLNESLTMIVEVDAPGIARPLGENFKDVARRVVAP